MNIAVIGGTCPIGSQVVKKLNASGNEAVPHSLSTGVDVITGQGLAEAVAGADAVVNLTNSPTFDDASPAFFRTSNAHPDGRTVVTDDTAGMFAAVHGDALTARGDAGNAPNRYSDWLY
ncbi:hypothetical protein ACFVH0_24965 [Streptomyces sp. NPDC127117]|uniref:hypothetical protein n=1 Tax=Streptomyces sp. NPDC127117 TaxID=3345368 RepID=UPI00362ABAC5